MLTADDATTWDLHADLVVVGGSGGGLVAAIAAARQGARVVLLERTKELGGGLARGRGMIPAGGTRLQSLAGIQDGPEVFANDILAQLADGGNPTLTLALCRAATDLVEWLVDSNITRLEFLPKLLVRSHIAPRMHGHAVGTGAELAADLVRTATKNPNVTVRPGSVVEDLWVDETATVVGVAARERRGPINVSGRRVLLACGSFAANPDLVAEHQQHLAAIPHAGVPGALGDGLRWAIRLGAATDHLGAAWVTALATAPGGLVVPDSLVRDGGFIVNQLGQRFADETTDALRLAQEVLAQPGKVAYLVFDERIYRMTREIDPYFARLIVPRAVRRNASPAELARHFEMDTEAFVSTLEDFHANVIRHTDPFGRTDAGPPFEPPFYAVRISGARLRALGGLRITETAQVVRADGTPVPSLYASGGAVADVCGGGPETYAIGNDTLMSLGWGFVAGNARPPEAD